MFPPYLLPHLPPCAPRKDRDTLDEKVKSQLLEREQEQIDRLVRESGGKLTRRLANSQVTADPVSERVFKALYFQSHCLRPQHHTQLPGSLTLSCWVSPRLKSE